MTWIKLATLAILSTVTTAKNGFKSLTYKDNSKIRIFYQEFTPEVHKQKKNQVEVLLLHGAAFSSQTWLEIRTLQSLQYNGYRTIAIDLPGYGKSAYNRAGYNDPANFINLVMEGFNMKNVVLISPSMSGMYAIPYMFSHHLSNRKNRLVGWVPVAPGGVTSHSIGEYENLKVPNVLVTFGENDVHGKRYSWKYLAKIPTAKVYEVKNAGHPAYLTDPGTWNSKLVKFLDGVKMPWVVKNERKEKRKERIEKRKENGTLMIENHDELLIADEAATLNSLNRV